MSTDRIAPPLPFLTTTVFGDLRLGVLLTPVWWAIGIEQFIWPPLLLLMVVKLLYMRGVVTTNRTVAWLVGFCLAQLISGLFIVEMFRFATLFRNLSTYITAALLLIVVMSVIEEWWQVRQLMACLLFVMVVAGIIGLLGVTGIWQPDFTSAATYFLPGWIKSTGYGAGIVHRATGYNSWFRGLSTYFRVSSIFLYPAMYATTLALSLPIAIFWRRTASGLTRRLVGTVIIVIMAVNLLFTTGRIATLGFLCGGFFFVFITTYRRTGVRTVLLAALLLLALGVSTLLSGVVSTERLSETVDVAVQARGTGSPRARAVIYTETAKGILQRPIFGWGTERDIPTIPYPAGSHSHYLGAMYKYGLVGAFLFFGALMSLWRATRPIATTEWGGDEPRLFLYYGRWFLVAALINSITDVLDIDGLTYFVFWFIAALLTVTRRQLLHRAPQ